MSPELLDPDKFGLQDCLKTKESDRYALGMVILEVLSGQVPFVGDRDVVVIRKIPEGKIPKRPGGTCFTNEVWGMLECCWAPKPQDRPGLEVVLRCLEKASASWTAPPHLIPSTANSSEGELLHQEDTLTTDVSWVSSPSLEAMSQPAQAPTTHGASAGRDNTQVQTFIRPPVSSSDSCTTMDH